MRPSAMALVAALLTVASTVGAQEEEARPGSAMQAASFTADGTALPSERLPVRALDHVAVLYALRDSREARMGTATIDGARAAPDCAHQFAGARSPLR